MNSSYKKGVSIIIPCYNSAWVIRKTLYHLSIQEQLNQNEVEILIVDNNSQDNTGEIAQQYWKELESPFTLRVVQEPKQGLTPTREKGIKESQHEYLILCDDDNLLCKNYVAKVKAIFDAHENVALIGGKGIPKFQENPDSRIEPFLVNYALGAQNDHNGKLSSGKYLYGAGLGIRQKAWDKLVSNGFTTEMKDRTGTSLVSGGDTEISYAFSLSGFDLWYEENITFEHFLKADRLTWAYLIKLIQALSTSSVLLRRYSYFYENYYKTTGTLQKFIWFRSYMSLRKQLKQIKSRYKLGELTADQYEVQVMSTKHQMREYIKLKSKLDKAIKETGKKFNLL